MKVHGKLAKVTTYETVGGVVCLFAAVVVLAHIKLFDTWPLMASVILSLAMMIGLPIASWITLGRMKQLQMGQRDLATTLREFARRRSQFLLVQKWGVISSVLMMIAFIPVTVRISSGDDVFQSGVEEYIWVCTSWHCCYIDLGSVGISLLFAGDLAGQRDAVGPGSLKSSTFISTIRPNMKNQNPGLYRV